MEYAERQAWFATIDDYTLEIDFDRFTIVELKCVLKMLYNTSTYCYGDISQLGDNVMLRMDAVGVRLREKANRGLAELVVETFNILKKIRLCDKILIEFRDKFNHYMYGDLGDSPVASPVKSPVKSEPPILVDPTEDVTEESIPKKMKKAFRKS